MRVLVDTNVVVDVVLKREPFFEDSYRILKSCSRKKLYGVLAAHTITNLFYILRKKFSNELLNKNFKDFEDCLQVECAKAANVDYIITRDKTDFVDSEISCVTPNEFCCMFSE